MTDKAFAAGYQSFSVDQSPTPSSQFHTQDTVTPSTPFLHLKPGCDIRYFVVDYNRIMRGVVD